MRVVINKKLMLSMFASFFVILFLGIVFGATVLNAPVASGNYSGTLTINLTVDSNGANNMTNVTCYYNSTGGAATTFLTEILNDSLYDTEFANTTISLSSLSDASTYNISCAIYNSTTLNNTLSAASITFDSTAPNVSTFYNTIDGGSYNGLTILNVSVNDSVMGIDSVYFNITNSSGTQVNFTKASGSVYFNATLSTSTFVDGIYNVTVYANDTQLNNLNNTEIITITLDNTAPVVTLTATTTQSTSLTLAATITDSGVTTCTVDRSGASISGSVVTESSLSCSTAYPYVVTCTDAAGNIGSSASTSFTTSSCGGSAPSNGWTSSNTITTASVTDGSSRLLRKNQRTQFTFDGTSHYIGVKDIDGEVVTIEIASDPVEYDFNVGDERKFDLNDDDVYDLYVKLNSITSGVANVFIKIIEETDSYEDVVGVDDNAGEVVDGTSGGDDPGILGDIVKDGKFSWVAWTALVIIIIAVVALVWFAKGKNVAVKKKR